MKRKRSGKPASDSPIGDEPAPPEQVRWKPVTRVVFRFCFVYLGLFALATQISGSMIPNLSFYYRGLGKLWPMRDVTQWVARNVFGAAELDAASGNGEPLFFWVQTFWLLIVAVLATMIWSGIDRRRENYDVLHKWFRLFVRFGLASQMFEYGMTKVIPTQFPSPSLETLVTPTGDLTMSRLLWTSIGASPAYEIFTGCIEVLGGVLLLLPRTTMLGALISLAAMTQVFALNMTYDIGLKQVTFHLIVLAVFLLAPDVPRLVDFFFRNRPPGVSTDPPLFAGSRANRIALAAQIAFGIYLVGMYAYINWAFWQVAGGGSPRSPLYGIWNVEDLSIDGQSRAPHLNDYDRRWRRVIFDEPDRVIFQRTDDSFARYDASIDPHDKTLVLNRRTSKKWKASFIFERPSPDRLILNGEMDGYTLRVQLRVMESDTFRLLNSNFRWIRPHDP
jgi:uncharacterized membrane protein YphA (DoxX/SURF4 family)